MDPWREKVESLNVKVTEIIKVSALKEWLLCCNDSFF